MPTTLRRVALILVLLGSWALVGSDRAPLPVTMSEAFAGLSAGGSGIPREDDRPSHDLSNPRIFTKAILYVKDQYVDPDRVKPADMMVSALEYVEKTVPDVMVEGTAEEGELRISVRDTARRFDIRHVDSLWKMSFAMKDILRFIKENMRPMEDTRDVEYAAVNGMLTKLDPHSVLLRPELYREMKLSTRGEFGGLGFIIQMREGHLTVVKVLPDTPARRAGIKPDDQIQLIETASTVNMDLNQAVQKLRGKVGSQVRLTVEREGWPKPKVLTLTRAMITIESVQSKLLANDVGYIRLKNFQNNTTRDLKKALAELEKQAGARDGLKGLVLDMRGNPGGLLEQAIEVSDLFIKKGTLVTTVGVADKLRDEKRAHPDPDDERYPMAVLVNSGSASASEIVAGALKNLDRAVIIGRQTFGKGSVQVLFDFPDESALKLTIAKYLTPGDISIQEVGIMPDIELVPTRVTEDRIDVFAPRKSIGEADLDAHFGQTEDGPIATTREEVLGREKPAERLRYLKLTQADQEKQEAEAKKESGEKHPLLDVDIAGVGDQLDDQLDAEAQDEIKEDFEVRFARQLLIAAPEKSRGAMLKSASEFIDGKQAKEERRIHEAIGALGLNWKKGPRPADARVSMIASPGPGTPITAGEIVNLELTVRNDGDRPLHRVRAWTESDNAYLDRREFVLGLIPGGETRTWTVPIRMPKDLTSRRDGVTFKLYDDQGELGEPIVTELNFVELPRPSFAFNWQVVDDCDGCNRDGQVQRGEKVRLLMDITNVGEGPALDTFAQIKNPGDEHVFIEKGRFPVGELAPGKNTTAEFLLHVKNAYEANTFPLKFSVLDEPLEEFTTDELTLSIAPPAEEVQGKAQRIRVPAETALKVAATAEARAFAQTTSATTLASDGKLNGMYRVALDDGRFGFVDGGIAKPSKAKATGAEIEPLAFRTPPRIELSVDPSKGGPVTDAESFVLTGTVGDPGKRIDLYVLVNDQKVFYRSIGGDQAGKPIPFQARFKLDEGNNHVLVVARESQDYAHRRTLVIRRRPEALADATKAGGNVEVRHRAQ